MATYMVEPDHGCGFMAGIFQRRTLFPRRSSARSLLSTPQGRKKEHGNSVEGAESRSERETVEKTVTKSVRRLSDAARNSASTTTTSSSSCSSSTTNNLTVTKAVRLQHSSGEESDSACELNRTSTNHNQATGVLRASSGNILQLAQMGSLRQQVNGNSTMAKYLPGITTTKALEFNVTMGNILRRSSDEIRFQGPMNKLDSEELKLMGNEKYKQGKYEEALALYDQAIAMDSNRAAYRSNKSAALTGLGRVLEAVLECREAVRIDPSYQRAHHRLATLYFRLGHAEEALQHFTLSGCLANLKDITQTKALQTCLSRCTDAKEVQDWGTVFRQTQNALLIGANSALQIYALQAQALLNLRRHDEAYEALKRGPKFDMDSYTQLFGQGNSTNLYLIKAQVYMATGWFEDAITAAQSAAQLNPNNKDVKEMVTRTRSVAVARSKGNKFFKELKFSEACSTYSEGLEYDPYNSVLLCNRAACRSKLGQFEKALEDCTLALNLQPSYSKARLRRAHCNAKMEKWKASIQDYEMLIREKPGDEEVGHALFEAQIQLKKQRGEDVKDIKFGSDVILVSSIECFRHLITSPGMCVVLFCNKSNQQKALPLLQHVCPRFPSINFLKVEVEDHPYLAKSEAVSNIPAFKIYKNGSRVKEIPGNSLELLENSVKLHCG